MLLATVVLALAALAGGGRAGAHLGNMSYSDIDVAGQRVLWRFKYAAHLTPGLPAGQGVPLTRGALLESQDDIQRWLGQTIEVADARGRCTGTVDNLIGPDANDDLQVLAVWECPGAPAASLRIVFRAFADKLDDWQNIASIRLAGKTYSTVFTPSSTRLSLGEAATSFSDGANTESGDDSASDDAGSAGTLRRFFSLGVQHIWMGYDHLLFLFAVLLAGGTMTRLLAIITSFTLAHSITLALAALGLVSLPPAVVEASIALSIVYVATENLFLIGADRRALVTFAFGLIHGFGFAGILAQSGLTPGGIALPLLAFNGGVEVGQLVVLAFFVPAIRAITGRKAFHPLERALSALIGLAGLVWAVERIGVLLR